MADAETEIPEVIRLQLRKPKNWNWELSTSKSSPNIVLPIIQLFDYKGQLLVEATDNGNALRRCWSSSNHSSITNSSNNNTRRRKISSNSVKRSRSDTAFNDKNIPTTAKQHETEIEVDPKKSADLAYPRRHRRTRSDDMFRRKLIPTKESMRRAEQDGYKNFLTTIIPEVAVEETEKKQKTVRRVYSAEIITNDNKPSHTQVSDVRGKKYITRTSKAGTLLLSDDESFLQKNSGKRSRHASKEYSIDNTESPIYNGTDGARGKTYHCHSRNMCDPHKGRFGEKMDKRLERSRSNPWANQRNPADPLDRKELRYSLSIGKFPQHHHDGNVGISRGKNKSFPLGNGFSLAKGRIPTCQRNKCNNKCVCETLFVENCREIHSNDGEFIEKNKKKKKQRGKLLIDDGVMDQIFGGINNRHDQKKVTSLVLKFSLNALPMKEDKYLHLMKLKRFCLNPDAETFCKVLQNAKQTQKAKNAK